MQRYEMYNDDLCDVCKMVESENGEYVLFDNTQNEINNLIEYTNDIIIILKIHAEITNYNYAKIKISQLEEIIKNLTT
jgi:hypothetical protein